MKLSNYHWGVLFFFFFFSCGDEKPQFIKDNASLFTETEYVAINQSLNNYYQLTGKQLLVYTIEGTDGILNIEKYTQQLVNRINYGSVGFDNSLVIFIYLKEHYIKFRWGSDFNKNISDEFVKDLIENKGEYFTKGDFEGGVLEIVEEIKSL